MTFIKKARLCRRSPFLLDEVGHPVGLAVVLQQLLRHVLHADEPRGHRLVDERRVGAPAERVAVFAGGRDHQPARLLQVADDLLVRVLAW